jgi:VacB/RNase II family 3'-5' exoribonuclease
MNPRHSSHNIDLRALANTVAAKNGFLTVWELDCLAQVKEIEKDLPARTQTGKAMGDLLWSSIDNNDSKDLDQIEYAEQLPGGDVRVLVGIADVDTFVPKGSPIDLHAAKNTTSVYTGIVIFPMLPDDLSSDLTSLRQDQDRAAIIMDMTVAKDGTIKSSEFYRASVCNKAKLAYAAVGRWFDGEAKQPSKDVAVDGLQEQLTLQRTESNRFHAVRARTGSLNLYTIEAQPVMADGKVVDIIVTDQNPARDLIENFMVAANSAMARFLDQHGSISIRRIVKSPKRWPRIVELAGQYGFKLPTEPDGRALNDFLAQRKLKDPEHFPDLSLSVVKLLGRGEYTVVKSGQSHDGHFGLGIQDYTHSTAPNRRYADLVTQRLVKAIIDGKPCPYTEAELDEIAKNCTQREDAANIVERFMRKAAAAVLLSNSIGETFDAIVTGVKEDGTYARMLKPPAEGRIVQNERGLDVGDKVRVRLLSVEPEKAFIDFKKV